MNGADDVLQTAQVHDSLDSALRGCALVLGTSARLRSLPMPLLDARRGARQAIAEANAGGGVHDVAVLFGRERYGLTNEEMQRCHYLVNIPSNPEYSSLNIAQAVQILAYEIRIAAQGFSDISTDPPDWEPVLNPRQPKRLMARLRRLFNRARPDQNEINILRGILKAAQDVSRGGSGRE